MGVIAIEEHWNHPALTRAVEALPDDLGDPSTVLDTMGDNLERLDELGDVRLAHMDEQGVDVQILSLAPPGTQPLDAIDAVPLARDANDIAAAAVARHPTRFRALATLPLADTDGSVAEVERVARSGFAGVMVYGRAGQDPLDAPRLDPVFEAAAALQLPVFVHPQVPSKTVRDAAYGGFDDRVNLGLATFGWGWHLEAALSALRLMLRGTLDRHPDLQLVLGHWGELLPFWTSRSDSLSRIAGLDRTISEYVRQNVHLTASGMLDPALLRHALAVTTPDRLLFSTDYPFQRPTSGNIAEFLTAFPDDAARREFTEGNARSLFGISD